MNATWSTALFGDVDGTAIYYVDTIDSANNRIKVTATQGSGISATLATKSGSMNLASVGWDHINPGTPIQALLDSSTIYYIEPRTQYTAPGFSQTAAATTVTLAGGTYWKDMACGEGHWVAIPSGNSTAAKSTNGSSWTSVSLPQNASWTSIAYGNKHFVAVSSGGTSNSKAIYSNSNGLGWRTSDLPTVDSWNFVDYGNGYFVALATDTHSTAYSTNYGVSWTSGNINGKEYTVAGSASLSTTQQKFGATSLVLNGTTDYITFPSSVNYAYGTGDFTIECWIRPSAFPAAQCIIDQRTTSNDLAILLELSAGAIARLYINGSYVLSGNTTITANTWTHIALSRVSGTTRLYVNGTVQTSTYSDSNDYAARPMRVGAYYSAAAYFGGYIDDLRVTNGTGYYVSTFTAPGSAQSFDTNTVLLMSFDGSNGSTSFYSTERWAGMVYGGGKFVAIGTNTAASYSTDGINWTAVSLPRSAVWSDIAYGNGRFVAVSSASGYSAYSLDGTEWNSSNIPVAIDKIAYGQGVFVGLNATSTTGYTSEDGLHWKERTLLSHSYDCIAFGLTDATYEGRFATLADTSTGSYIKAGSKTKARAIVTSGVVTAMTEWEPGSNYSVAPTVTFTDPNITTLASVTPRLSNGALGNPTFIDRGTGYNNNSTTVTITGNGYADAYQTGLTLILNNLTNLPQPGDNLTIDGVSQIFKVTSAEAVFGTTAPNIEANVQVAPDVSVALSPENAANVVIRQKYSQVRLTGHDFLNVGYGTFLESNYPDLPTDTVLAPQDQAVEVNYGRVFFTSTDQDGNFNVGGLFGVQQATGIVTLSASQFGLTGLETLSLGGIAVGGNSVVVNQFSTDGSFVANSDNIIPTQKAIKTYLTARLSQGGSNTFTGQLTAGTIIVGGPDKISSTIPNGTTGSNIKMVSKVNFNGAGGAVGGNLAALDFFLQGAFRRSDF